MSAETTITGTQLERLWSVTTLLKMALGASGGLVYWNCEQTAIAAIDKRSTVEAMLRESGRDETVKWLVQERWNATERARVRGTNVHKWAEAKALGQEPPPLDPVEEPYARQLLRWWERYRPEFVMAEAPVYNTTLRYAGTCDGLFRVGGQTVLFDYKTTEKGPGAKSRPPYKEAALQLAAYARAELVGVLSEQRYDSFRQRYYLFDPTAQHEPMPQVDGALCIVVSPEDCFAVPVAIDDDTFRAFRAALAVARFLTERDPFGPPLQPTTEGEA